MYTKVSCPPTVCLPIIMRNYISPVFLILPRIPHIIGTFNILATLRISCFFPTEGGQRGDIRGSHQHPTGRVSFRKFPKRGRNQGLLKFGGAK